MNTERNLSLEQIKDDTILLGDEDQEKIMAIIKNTYVQKMHHREISLTSKGRWKTYIGNPRKPIERKNKEDLIDYLYQYYKNAEEGPRTFREVFQMHEQYKIEQRNRSKNTISRDYQVYERFIDEDFGSTDIKDFTQDFLNDYILERVKAIKPKEKALKGFFSLLNGTFEFACRKRYLSSNPFQWVDKETFFKDCDMTQKNGDEKIFSVSEINRIKEHEWNLLKEKGYDPRAVALLWAIETGMRIGEIPPLRRSDVTDESIHIHRQQLLIRQKGKPQYYEEVPYTKNERRHPKGGRYFPVTDEIAKLLRYIDSENAKNHITSEFLFCFADGTPVNKTQIERHIGKQCSKLGLTITNNHAFRMSLNSNVLIPLGIPVTERASILGHSVQMNENSYAYSRQDKLDDVREKLNKAGLSESINNIIPFSNKKTLQVQ